MFLPQAVMVGMKVELIAKQTQCSIDSYLGALARLIMSREERIDYCEEVFLKVE